MSEILRIIVDLSNVLFSNSVTGKAKTVNYFILKNSLEKFSPDALIFLIADASLRHKVDNSAVYKEICKQGGVIQAPAGEIADYYIIKYARMYPNSIIISRDRFKDFKIDKELQKRVIPFVIVGDEFLFSPKLDSRLHSINKINHLITVKCD